MELENRLKKRLEERRNNYLYRARKIRKGPPVTEILYNNQSYLSFCSNDYLSLSNHPEVKNSFKKGIELYGSGSGSSSMINGYSTAHAALEEELAAFTGYERALVFSSGYMANIGVLTALLGRFDTVYQDKLNHASLIDGGLSSKSKLYRYPHNDHNSLKKLLAKTQKNNIHKDNATKLIVTEGVFSMEGDIAPLNALSSLSKSYQSLLMVDDSHGIGVLGKQGRGALEYYDLNSEAAQILVGSFGKAFGGFGAFVAANDTLIETFIQCARSYCYTTAFPAANVEAARMSLRIIQKENDRREMLTHLIGRFKKGIAQLDFNYLASDTPIQSIVVGEPSIAIKMGALLESRQILVGIIRPPTVPVGKARLRISITAAHTERHIDSLLDALEWTQKFIQKS